MSTKTTNFEFIKPEKTDPADITATNENWDKVDAELVKRSHDLSMDGHRITDVAEPTNGSDVATRHFVEQHSIEGNTYVAVDYSKDGNVTIKPYVADEDELTFKSHISNKNNPHNVTAEQVGAIPVTSKPKGGYTGNGSASSRIENIGGLGNAILISSGWGFAIVTNQGGFAVNQTNSSTSILPKSEATFVDGVLTLATTNGVVNGNYTWFTCQVL